MIILYDYGTLKLELGHSSITLVKNRSISSFCLFVCPMHLFITCRPTRSYDMNHIVIVYAECEINDDYFNYCYRQMYQGFSNNTVQEKMVELHHARTCGVVVPQQVNYSCRNLDCQRLAGSYIPCTRSCCSSC